MKHSKKHDDNPFKEMQNDENQAVDETAAEDSEAKTDSSAELSDLQAKYDVLNQQYIRLAADFDNYRKRQESERENLLKYGSENALKKMLEILDNFERGEKALENVEDCQTVKDSFNLIRTKPMSLTFSLKIFKFRIKNQCPITRLELPIFDKLIMPFRSLLPYLIKFILLLHSFLLGF